MLWRDITETLEKEIEGGILEPGGRLPPDHELASRFGVNRHTVRRALTDLRSRGLVRSLQGRGTFVVEDAHDVRLAAQARFEEDLLAASKVPQRKLLSVATLPAPSEIAEALKIRSGDPVLLTTSVGEASDVPIHVTRIYYNLRRAPTLEHGFRDLAATPGASFSLHKSLAFAGISDFQRIFARISCRLPTQEEAGRLKMGTNEPVMETRIVNATADRVPIFFAVTVYPGKRVNFVVEP